MKSRHLKAATAAVNVLARVCVRNGYGIAAVEHALRKAFAVVASERCQLANGRPNHAHINAATGLPRSVIRSLLRGKPSSVDSSSLVDSTPAAKVLVRMTGRTGKQSEGEGDSQVTRRLQRKLAPDSTHQALVKEINYLRNRKTRGNVR
jgi:hypothetical protein